eukprot:scaffold320165_cov18-Prasinocladus_malaysianus.AAC.1
MAFKISGDRADGSSRHDAEANSASLKTHTRTRTCASKRVSPCTAGLGIRKTLDFYPRCLLMQFVSYWRCTT